MRMLELEELYRKYNKSPPQLQSFEYRNVLAQDKTILSQMSSKLSLLYRHAQRQLARKPTQAKDLKHSDGDATGEPRALLPNIEAKDGAFNLETVLDHQQAKEYC